MPKSIFMIAISLFILASCGEQEGPNSPNTRQRSATIESYESEVKDYETIKERPGDTLSITKGDMQDKEPVNPQPQNSELTGVQTEPKESVKMGTVDDTQFIKSESLTTKDGGMNPILDVNNYNISRDRSLVIKAQKALKDRGYKVGEVDGVIGLQTTRAIEEFQQENRIKISGQLDARTLEALNIDYSEEFAE